MMVYTIRYRSYRERAGTALIVEDRWGASYLFSAGRLQFRLRRADAGERLAQLLARRGTWSQVPTAAPYTLPELVRLVEGDHATSAA